MEGDGGSCDARFSEGNSSEDAKAITGCCTEHLAT